MIEGDIELPYQNILNEYREQLTGIFFMGVQREKRQFEIESSGGRGSKTDKGDRLNSSRKTVH